MYYNGIRKFIVGFQQPKFQDPLMEILISLCRRTGYVWVDYISSSYSGVERITFTDLMFVVKVSKSSLNHSVSVLEQVGYVIVQKGFKTTGGPRTFIEITDEGKKAISVHLETMRRLLQSFCLE